MRTYFDFMQSDERKYLPMLTFNEISFMKKLVSHLTEEIVDERDDIACDEQNIELVSGIEYDGWIPFMHGGFAATIPALMGYAQGSGKIPKIIKPFLEQANKEIEELFKEKTGKSFIDWGELTDEESNIFYDIENEYFSNDEPYFYKIQIYKDYKNQIILRCYINTDFGYGRDYISWMPEKEINSNAYYRTFKVSDNWTKENVEKICEQVGYEVIKFVNNL